MIVIADAICARGDSFRLRIDGVAHLVALAEAQCPRCLAPIRFVGGREIVEPRRRRSCCGARGDLAHMGHCPIVRRSA